VLGEASPHADSLTSALGFLFLRRRQAGSRWCGAARYPEDSAGPWFVEITVGGVLFARTVTTATSWVLFELLHAFYLAFLLLEKAVLVIPVEGHSFKSVGPVLVLAFLDKSAFFARAGPGATLSGFMTIFEAVTVVQFLIEPL